MTPKKRDVKVTLAVGIARGIADRNLICTSGPHLIRKIG